MSPILSLILNKIQEQTIISPFVIVHGPGVDVQWSAVREACQTATGFFAYHDVLEIKDYTKELGKIHFIRVGEDTSHIDTKMLLNDYAYKDIGAREIKNRLEYAPAGDMKILLIENMERGKTAFNALLKSLEEPLSNRIIIASTKNKDTLLPTILSRALLIHCDAEYTPASLDEDGKKLLSDIIWALETKDIAGLSKGASQIAKSPVTREVIDNLIYHFNGSQQYHYITPCITTLRMISSNVSAEHSLFQLFLTLIR